MPQVVSCMAGQTIDLVKHGLRLESGRLQYSKPFCPELHCNDDHHGGSAGCSLDGKPQRSDLVGVQEPVGKDD